MCIPQFGHILFKAFQPSHALIYVKYHLGGSEDYQRGNVEVPAGLKQVASMGHFILMELPNPAVYLKAMYPYTDDQARLYASITKLITLFSKASISCVTSISHLLNSV
jgi:hypothetical protein